MEWNYQRICEIWILNPIRQAIIQSFRASPVNTVLCEFVKKNEPNDTFLSTNVTYHQQFWFVWLIANDSFYFDDLRNVLNVFEWKKMAYLICNNYWNQINLDCCFLSIVLDSYLWRRNFKLYCIELLKKNKIMKFFISGNSISNKLVNNLYFNCRMFLFLANIFVLFCFCFFVFGLIFVPKIIPCVPL